MFVRKVVIVLKGTLERRAMWLEEIIILRQSMIKIWLILLISKMILIRETREYLCFSTICWVCWRKGTQDCRGWCL